MHTPMTAEDDSQAMMIFRKNLTASFPQEVDCGISQCTTGAQRCVSNVLWLAMVAIMVPRRWALVCRMETQRQCLRGDQGIQQYLVRPRLPQIGGVGRSASCHSDVLFGTRCGKSFHVLWSNGYRFGEASNPGPATQEEFDQQHNRESRTIRLRNMRGGGTPQISTNVWLECGLSVASG